MIFFTNFARVRYAIGNKVRLISQPWYQRNITPEIATTIFACSFHDKGWHHIRKTLAELDANSCLNPSDSALAHFLREFSPTSISILAGVLDEEPLPLFMYPWGTFQDGTISTDKCAEQSRFCGPSSDQFIEEEFSRTVALYRHMRVWGYVPMKFPNSFITGTWLEALDGKQRFVVMQGNHRMAVLAHLRVSYIPARTSSASLRRVKECELENWPMVEAGRCSPAHARKIFHFFFKQNGWHVANAIGLSCDQ